MTWVQLLVKLAADFRAKDDAAVVQDFFDLFKLIFTRGDTPVIPPGAMKSAPATWHGPGVMVCRSPDDAADAIDSFLAVHGVTPLSAQADMPVGKVDWSKLAELLIKLFPVVLSLL